MVDEFNGAHSSYIDKASDDDTNYDEVSDQSSEQSFHPEDDEGDGQLNNNRKGVSFNDEPLVRRITSGAYEINSSGDPTRHSSDERANTTENGTTNSGLSNDYEGQSEHSNKPTTIHRRLSVQRGGDFDLSKNFKNLSSIPPPVPESLPTTPGFEISGDMYFNRQDPLTFPQQQQSLSRNESEANLAQLINHPADGTDLSTSTATATEEGPLMTLKNPPRNLWRVLAVSIWAFSAGASDGAPGAILLDIENYYNINYSVVSMIWLSNAVGFLVIATISDKMDARLGKQKMISFGCLMILIMYAITCSGTLFPVVCVGFFFGGLGLATCLSQMNVFLSRFDKASTYLGWFHGSYGMGAAVAPILATTMVNAGVEWYLYYSILVGLTVFNATNCWFAFTGADEDLRPWDHQEVIHEENEEPTPEDEIALNLLNLSSNVERANRDYRNGSVVSASGTKKSDQMTETTTTTTSRKEHTKLPIEPVIPKGDFKLAIKNSRTWLLTLFVFFYQGAEVTLPGWLETFLTEYRDGDKSKLGYVASGFWAGLTLGRLLLVERIHKDFGAKRGVTVLLIGAIVFASLGWAVDNIIAESVFVSIAGVFVGPVYPLMITIATRVLPRKIQVISLTIMTSGGSSGGALWPFLTGLLSQFCGAFAVMPVFISLFAAGTVCWYLLPNPDRSIVKTPWQRLF